MKYLVMIDNNQYLLESNKKTSIQTVKNLQVGDSLSLKNNVIVAYTDEGKLFYKIDHDLDIKVDKIFKEKKVIIFKKLRRKDSQKKSGHKQQKMLVSIKQTQAQTQ